MYSFVQVDKPQATEFWGKAMSFKKERWAPRHSELLQTCVFTWGAINTAETPWGW